MDSITRKRIFNDNLKINTKSSMFGTTNKKFFPLSSKNNGNGSQVSLQIQNKNFLTSRMPLKEKKSPLIFNSANAPKIKFSSPTLRLKCKNINKGFSPIKVNEINMVDLMKENKILKEQIQRLLIENKNLKEEKKSFQNLYQTSNESLKSSSSIGNIGIMDKLSLKNRKQRFFSNDYNSPFLINVYSTKIENFHHRDSLSQSKDYPLVSATSNENTTSGNFKTINSVNSAQLMESKSSKNTSKKSKMTLNIMDGINERELNSLNSFHAQSGSNFTINTSLNKQDDDYEAKCITTFQRAKNILEKYDSLLNVIGTSSNSANTYTGTNLEEEN